MAQFEDKIGFSYKEARRRIKNNRDVYRKNPQLANSVLNQVKIGEGPKAAEALRKEFNRGY